MHSYALSPKRTRTCYTSTDYSGPVTAAVARDQSVGVQFHPEKSQAIGLKLLGNFLFFLASAGFGHCSVLDVNVVMQAVDRWLQKAPIPNSSRDRAVFASQPALCAARDGEEPAAELAVVSRIHDAIAAPKCAFDLLDSCWGTARKHHDSGVNCNINQSESG